MNTHTQLSISEIRAISEYAQQQGCTSRDLYNFICTNGYELDKIIESVQRHDCALDDILSDTNVFEYDGLFFNTDNWLIADDTRTPIHTDDANYCEHTNCWVEEDCVRVRTGLNTSERWRESIAQRDCYEYDGDYYTRDGMDYYDLIITEEGDVMHIESAYYWESDSCYHSRREPRKEYVRDYHHNSTTYCVNFTDAPQFFIGFEIEKEDAEVKQSIFISDFESTCPDWKKERDGSLDSYSGYELISPKFELEPNKIKKHILKNDTLVKHINADKSTSCGGHINVSEKGKTGEELFDEVKGYTPLFYALYYKRVDKHYCKGKKNAELKSENDKYQAIKIHSNRIEYRIVSAVPNVDTLIWRAKVIDYIMKNKTNCPVQAFMNANEGELKSLLVKMYGANFKVLIKRLIEFTAKYEDININPNGTQTSLI